MELAHELSRLQARTIGTSCRHFGHPAPFDGACEIEIRPLFEAEDFGAALSPELRAAEERLRAGAAGRH